MDLKSRRFYITTLILLLSSIAWVIYNNLDGHSSYLQCPFKRFIGIPCPACGLTTGVFHVLRGEFILAMTHHPLAVFILPAMMVTLILCLTDLIFKKSTLYKLYLNINTRLQKPPILISLIIFLVCIWIYNLLK